MIIKFYKNHHVIIDEQCEILGYRYRIKLELLRILEETTAALPCTGVNASNRENYSTRHYTVWRNYSMELFESTKYQK
jgi:hypothetical protein